MVRAKVHMINIFTSKHEQSNHSEYRQLTIQDLDVHDSDVAVYKTHSEGESRRSSGRVWGQHIHCVAERMWRSMMERLQRWRREEEAEITWDLDDMGWGNVDIEGGDEGGMGNWEILGGIWGGIEPSDNSSAPSIFLELVGFHFMNLSSTFMSSGATNLASSFPRITAGSAAP
ncbi:hypothetical protein Tco_1400071 [Tanacetum coccineum]